jgi:hypothetical protein
MSPKVKGFVPIAELVPGPHADLDAVSAMLHYALDA